MGQQSPTLDDFKSVLTDTLNDLQGIKNEAVKAVVEEYAPRLADLAVSDDPQGERDDIVTNAKLKLADLGIQAETAVGQVITKVLQALANMALKFSLS